MPSNVTTVSRRSVAFQKIAYRKSRAACLCWFVASLALIVGPVARAQSGDYLERIGLPDFAVPHKVEMGFTNIPNGGLHLDFPMGNVPQRGGKSVVIKLTYDSLLYGLGTYFNGLVPKNVVGGDGGWKVIMTGAQADRILNSNGCTESCLGINYAWNETPCNPGWDMGNVSYGTFSNYSWTSVDGVSKTFSITTYDGLGTGDCLSGPNSSAWADDGSGFFMVVTNNTQAVVYDNAGNMTKKTAISGGAYTTYTWDYRNRLTDVQA